MTEQKYTTILVPVDGSKAAELAFDRGVEIAKRNHSHLDVLNVIDLNQFTVSFAGMVDASGDVVYQAFEDVSDYLKNLVERAHEAGWDDVAMHVRYGSPRSVIAKEFIKDHGIDLIVMGPTGANPVERLFLGSVTDYVTRTAPCDIIIAR
ncbi:universal stress protein [Ligilactobacillus sp.]|uniref:universal stress protein n=1 Tax=Ligilactobacillus sp. TaxID=2767921 RepID=UPI002FE2315E